MTMIMKVVGFKFNKVFGEKKGENIEGLRVNTNIDVFDIKEIKSSGFFGGKEQILDLSFKYEIDYAPSYALISLEGNIMISAESRIAKEIIQQWKDKKLPTEFRVELFNIIIKKASVKSLFLEEELNIPYHMPFPKISIKDSKVDSEKKE